MAKNTFVFVGGYSSLADAQADYELIKDLDAEGALATYDAVVITKRADGSVHVNKDELPTRHGAWTGIGVGALLGIVFPPSIIGTAAAGGVAGGVIGYLWHGMSRGDMKDLGEALDEGQAPLIMIGEDKLPTPSTPRGCAP
jgi:uncharacterized membrane protein